jgi:ribosomal protein L34
MTTKPPLKRFFKDSCTKKMKANKTMKGQEIPNYRRRKGRKVKSNISSAAHNPTLNQQRKLHDRIHHIPINTNTEC